MPQTLGFVIAKLKAAAPDPQLAEYAAAQVFSDSRAAASYEERGEGMAEDLADSVRSHGTDSTAGDGRR